MTGYIYKITNIITNKVYIGQTNKTIQERFERHLYDALRNPKPLKTKLACAIRKYGEKAFKIELIELIEGTTEQITDREYFWISYYDSVSKGYNSTDARCKSGGNTYAGKSADEIADIKQKISLTKLGSLNPNARAVKCLNIKTNEVTYYTTAQEATEAFGEPNHQFVSRRCRGLTKKLYKETYLFAYAEDDFITDYHYGTATPRNRKLTIVDEHGNSKVFESIAVAERAMGWYRGAVNTHQAIGKYKTYQIILG